MKFTLSCWQAHVDLQRHGMRDGLLPQLEGHRDDAIVLCDVEPPSNNGHAVRSFQARKKRGPKLSHAVVVAVPKQVYAVRSPSRSNCAPSRVGPYLRNENVAVRQRYHVSW
jgi:hypothetical protein